MLSMNPEQHGIPLRSNPEVYSHGNGINFKLDFLSKARSMNAPEVNEIDVLFYGTVGAVSGGALGRDAAKLFDAIKVRDSQDIINASGAGLRVLEQHEIGNKQVDPADLTSGTSNSTYLYRLKLLFSPPRRAVRGRDFAIPLAHLLEAGEFTINTAAAVPTGWNTIQADWKIQLVAFVSDGRQRELKSRRRIKEEQISNTEFDYQINGFLRNAFVTSKLTTTGYTDLSGYATLNSRTLNWPSSYQTHNLVDDYRFNTDAVGTNDEFVRAATGALAIVQAERGQKTGAMIDMKSLHLEFPSAVPTGGRLLTDVIIDRDGEMGALSMGYPSPGELANAVRQMGEVVGESGNYKVSGFNQQLARKLPIRIKPGGANH